MQTIGKLTYDNHNHVAINIWVLKVLRENLICRGRIRTPMFCLFNPLLKTSRGEDLKNLYSPCTIMFLLLKLLKKTITSPVLLLHFLNCLSCPRCSPKRPVSVFFSILLLLNYFFFLSSRPLIRSLRVGA